MELHQAQQTSNITSKKWQLESKGGGVKASLSLSYVYCLSKFHPLINNCVNLFQGKQLHVCTKYGCDALSVQSS
jgi:hypothetical protein